MDWSTRNSSLSNKYSKNILKDYSSKNKFHRTLDEQIDTHVYTVAYAFRDQPESVL